jgi:serine/threonine-protein kinase HipA
MLALARECGINSAHSKIVDAGGQDIVLVKRFDRERVEEGYWRHRMVSGLTILNSEDTASARGRWSYLALADEIRRRSSQSSADLVELYRRVVFNALISNTDDHPRNHALIAPGRNFQLSPTFDLTPNPLVSLEKRDLAMTAGEFNRYANRANLLSAHARFKLTREDAETIIDRTQRIVRERWYALLRECGMSEADCNLVAGAFNYPGFDLDPKETLKGL